MLSSAHIDLDAFFATAEQERLGAVGKPLVVGGTGLRGAVSSASYEARRLGIKAGGSTLGLKDRYPGIIIVNPDIEYYKKTSERVMKAVSSVELPWQQLSIDEAVIDLRGAGDSLGRDEWAGVRIMERLRTHIREETGLSTSVGVSQGHLSAKVASEEAKPNGMRIVTAEEIEHWWRQRECRVIPGIGTETESVLNRHEIRTLGDAVSVGERNLRDILGESRGVWLYGCATLKNDVPGLPGGVRSGASMSAGHTLERDTGDVEVLARHTQPLVAALCGRLLQERQVSGCVGVRIKWSNGKEESRRKRCRLEREYSYLYRVARDVLLDVMRGEFREVRGITVFFEQIADGDAAASLFEENDTANETGGLTPGSLVTHPVLGDGVLIDAGKEWWQVAFADRTRWVMSEHMIGEANRDDV